MGIAAVIGSLLLVVIVNSAGLFSIQLPKIQIGLNINDTLLKVRTAIKEASFVASQYTDGATTYTSGADQLVLKVASTDAANNIIANTYDFFVLFLDQSFLRLKIFPDPSSFRKPADHILSVNAGGLAFQYFNTASPPLEVPPQDAAKIKVTLTLGTDTATSEANLRNEF